MTTWARIVNNRAVDVTVADNIDHMFHADVVAQFVVVPDGTGDNDSLNPDTGAWTPAPVVPDPEPPPPPELETDWFIDIGPFFDRFGSAKMAVLTSSNATVKAILADVSVRKWVDLKRSDVAMAITVIGSIVPEVNSDLKTAILTTPLEPSENMALRKLYF